ncbi:uncharacterized protein ISCGN_005300 [Ixodes scapularis]
MPQYADDIFEVSTPTRPKKAVYPGASSPDTSLSRKTTGINKTATFWYNNCRSVKNKIPDLQTLASSLPHCSTILLSETWLDASVADSELLPLDAYTVFRRDRGGRGGGVLMAIPSSFRVNRRCDLEHKDLEALFVEFFLPRGTILVSCVYCPPSSREKAYRLLDSSLEAAASKPYVNTLIFGDFNCHVDWCSHEVPVPRDNTDDVLLETTTAAGLVQVCQQPSYTSREGVPSFLDLVFTSNATRIELVETSEGLHGSDHLAVELRCAVSLPRTGHHALRLWRFRQLDFGHMAQLAHLTPWCMTTTGSDWSSNYDLWCDFMFAIQKECVPCSTHSSKRKRLPWITSDIIKAARTKRILFRRARQSHCPAALRLAKEHQRTLKAAIYVSHQQYVRDIAERAKTDPKVFWTFISQLRFDKYKGGLDTVHDLTGTESVYTAWKNIEIMFHVSTMLPHEEHDPQKLQKKRHIGNDIVCVVFLEAENTPFSPACIKSHFLHAFIVVRASPAAPSGTPTVYEVSVVSRDEVGAYKPYLWHRSVFPKGTLFREWLLTKIVNGERTSYSAPKFARMQDRTRSQMLEDMVTNLQNHAETGQIPKPYRRGSWRPIGHMRPSSPLLDSVRDPFEGYDQLARDFAKMFQSTRQLCDVVFNVGQGKEKTKVYAVRAILAVRSRVFLEMLYGFSTGFGLSSSGPGDSSSRVLSPSTAKSSGNFLQVPDIHDAPRNKSAPSSPMVIRAFSRLGNWTGWSSRTSSKDPLIPDIGGLKRWQSECNCKEKEKERNTVMAGTTVTLSVCADAHKVDRAKLCQHEFNIIEFDSDTFQLLVDYLHCGSCPLTCEAIPALICAAEHFDLPELLQACFHHAKTHLRLSVVCAMLNVLDNYYWRYTSATELVNMILQFVDTRAVALFSRQEFLELSESMFQSIIGRELNIPEVYKFEIMLRWATHHVTTVTRPDPQELQCTMSRLTRELKLHLIPPQELIKVVLPTRTISHEQILETLLYQADTGMFRVRQSYLEAVNKKGERYLLSPALTKYRR